MPRVGDGRPRQLEYRGRLRVSGTSDWETFVGRWAIPLFVRDLLHSPSFPCASFPLIDGRVRFVGPRSACSGNHRYRSFVQSTRDIRSHPEYSRCTAAPIRGSGSDGRTEGSMIERVSNCPRDPRIESRDSVQPKSIVTRFNQRLVVSGNPHGGGGFGRRTNELYIAISLGGGDARRDRNTTPSRLTSTSNLAPPPSVPDSCSGLVRPGNVRTRVPQPSRNESLRDSSRARLIPDSISMTSI